MVDELDVPMVGDTKEELFNPETDIGVVLGCNHTEDGSTCDLWECNSRPSFVTWKCFWLIAAMWIVSIVVHSIAANTGLFRSSLLPLDCSIVDVILVMGRVARSQRERIRRNDARERDFLNCGTTRGGLICSIFIGGIVIAVFVLNDGFHLIQLLGS